MAQSQQWQKIPTHLTFEEFVLPHLYRGGPQPALFARFSITLLNFVPRVSVERAAYRKRQRWTTGDPLYPIYGAFRLSSPWVLDIFEESVLQLHQQEYLDISVIHGDGTTTVAKKRRIIPDSAGNKHLKGDKVVPFCDQPAMIALCGCSRQRIAAVEESTAAVTRIAKKVDST